jgi:hypothetical protein
VRRWAADCGRTDSGRERDWEERDWELGGLGTLPPGPAAGLIGPNFLPSLFFLCLAAALVADGAGRRRSMAGRLAGKEEDMGAY